ncbi:MAG: glycosyltransferase family 4 protein [Anaerolineales bacterium]|nr:glycosyltransferase family 4 protein [Anaerolineales bacterium]
MSSKNLGFISTRLAGTDGVSLETAKLTIVFDRLGHRSFYCAGELDVPLKGNLSPRNSSSPRAATDPNTTTTPRVTAARLVPAMHFTHPDAVAIHDAMFGLREATSDLVAQITAQAVALKEEIRQFVDQFQIDLLIIQNALAIPMHIPLGVALTEFIEETGIPAIAHNHDLYWERARYRNPVLPKLIEHCFPPDLPSLRHVVINSPAQAELIRRKGVESEILPNIFDFATAPPGIDTFNQDLRAALGLQENHLFILQPTRVIPRKGIELSIELLRRLYEPKKLARLGKEPILVITHHAGDEGMDYLRETQKRANEAGVPLLYVPDRFAPTRSARGKPKIYSLWDAYIHADFVTYPSLIEGFGNALLETLYFRLPGLVNRYEIYRKDIHPLGFDLIEIDRVITEKTVESCIDVIINPIRRRQMVQWNYQLARQHFSYEAVTPLLAQLVGES